MANTTPVIILCGGLGSRLWPLTDIYQKALIPVAGKPCVKWIIEELYSQGFRNITLSINSGSENEFRNALNLPVEFAAPPTLTSGCDRILHSSHKFITAKKFIVIYGDDLTHTDYRQLLEPLKEADVVLATTTGVNLEFGLVNYWNGKVRSFTEKPQLVSLTRPGIWTGTRSAIWTGRAAMRTDSLRYLVGREDLSRDVFPAMLQDGRRIAVLNSDTPWYDVGSIAHWRRANEEYAKT